METKATYPPWQHQPFRLHSEDIKDPMQIIREFVNGRTLPEHRDIQWEMLSALLSGDAADYFTGKEAGEWVLYFRQIEEVTEACYLLAQPTQPKENTP